MANTRFHFSRVALSKDTFLDLKWCGDNIKTASNSLKYLSISKIIYTGSSNVGWEASCEGMSIGGTWFLEEKRRHVNVLELKTILLGLKSFIKRKKIHMKVLSDSTNAIAGINKIGTFHSDIYHHFAKQIWEWVEKKGIHITAAHVPGDKNIETDKEFREVSVYLEWMLCSKILSKALVLLNYTPKVDLFISNVNHNILGKLTMVFSYIQNSELCTSSTYF